ncbi:MAG TPA: methyltransferase domain-containing protein [Gammaproteobacteria bacterium]|nr:methyltransferase domain-containing protein [Gammaproteobacteria bacterium]
MSQYHLKTDSVGRKRLNLQGKVYNPGSQQFLLDQGLKKGWSVLEVGCGSGTMTSWLAEQVGKRGRVVCIDNSSAQIRATKQVVKKNGLKQVECHELSVFDLDQLKEKFDLVYSRFVLIHLDDPLNALIKIKDRLKTGGRLVINDMLNSCSFCYPGSPVFDQRRKILEQFSIKNGLNPNFSLTLPEILRKIKLKILNESVFQPLLTTPVNRKLLTLIFYEIKDKLIALNILTASEWELFMRDLEKIQKDTSYFVTLSSMHQICIGK